MLTSNAANLNLIKLFFWISLPFAIMSAALVKVLVALGILRLLGPSSRNWQRWTLYIGMALTMLFNSVVMILGFAQCSSPSRLWGNTVGIC